MKMTAMHTGKVYRMYKKYFPFVWVGKRTLASSIVIVRSRMDQFVVVFFRSACKTGLNRDLL